MNIIHTLMSDVAVLIGIALVALGLGGRVPIVVGIILIILGISL